MLAFGYRQYGRRTLATAGFRVIVSVVMCWQVKREKADVQQTIDNLIKAIEDKEVFIRVAQSRLQERTQRLGCENCHDKPMIG